MPIGRSAFRTGSTTRSTGREPHWITSAGRTALAPRTESMVTRSTALTETACRRKPMYVSPLVRARSPRTRSAVPAMPPGANNMSGLDSRASYDRLDCALSSRTTAISARLTSASVDTKGVAKRDEKMFSAARSASSNRSATPFIRAITAIPAAI